MLDEAVQEPVDVAVLMADIGKKARAATRTLATAPSSIKNTALHAMSDAIMLATPAILAANAKDIEAMTANGQSAAYIDRGMLTSSRIR